jgi:hypothetical protein
MSKLAEFLKTHAPTATPATPATLYLNSSDCSSGTHANSDFSEEQESPSLSPLQEAGRQQVLSQLDANPNIKRAFVNRFEVDGTMIVTLAIRGIGTGELKIPADRFSQGSLDDYGALLNMVEGAA